MSLGWAQEAKKEEKANLVFGKTMELEMEMVSVPDSDQGVSLLLRLRIRRLVKRGAGCGSTYLFPRQISLRLR